MTGRSEEDGGVLYCETRQAQAPATHSRGREPQREARRGRQPPAAVVEEGLPRASGRPAGGRAGSGGCAGGGVRQGRGGPSRGRADATAAAGASRRWVI